MQVAVDMGTASSISFPPSLICHSKNPSCMENMRIILRLQAGTARRTPIEGAPLKKRLIPGKRSTSLHPSQIHSVSGSQTYKSEEGGERRERERAKKRKINVVHPTVFLTLNNSETLPSLFNGFVYPESSR